MHKKGQISATYSSEDSTSMPKRTKTS